MAIRSNRTFYSTVTVKVTALSRSVLPTNVTHDWWACADLVLNTRTAGLNEQVSSHRPHIGRSAWKDQPQAAAGRQARGDLGGCRVPAVSGSPLTGGLVLFNDARGDGPAVADRDALVFCPRPDTAAALADCCGAPGRWRGPRLALWACSMGDYRGQGLVTGVSNPRT
jgi:hypothetical protein